MLYLQRRSTDFRNLCLSSKVLRVGIWAKSFMCAKFLLLKLQGENFAHRQHLKFFYIQPVHCAIKNPTSPTVFNRFTQSLPQLEDVQGGHSGGKFQVRRYFTCAMARWKLRASKKVQFCHFQPVNSASKNPISPKAFTRFSKSLAQLEHDEGGHLGGKFQVRTFFTVKMARWKLCAWTTFEIWPLSTGALGQKKSYTITPKVFNRFSKSSHHLEDGDGGHLIGKFQVRRYFTFAMVMWKLCASTTFEILQLSTCTLCEQKSYISKYIQPIFEIFASARWCWGSALGGKLQMCRYFSFAMGRWKICASTTFESLPLSTCALFQKNAISPKAFNRFSKSWPQLEDVEGGHLGEKFQVRTCFTFKMGRWKLGPWTTFGILPLSICTLCKQKSHISKGIQLIFEIFASARRGWGWAFGWEVSGAQVFYFCSGKVKTLHIDNIWNFATFHLYTVRAKILYLERHSKDFRNLLLGSKMLRVGIWAVSFRCARVLLLKWEG